MSLSPVMLTILNASTDAVVIVNKESEILAVNTMATRMFGYSEAQLIGQRVTLLMPDAYRNVHDKFVQRYIETKEAKVIGIGRPLHALHANGDTFEMFLTLTEIVDGEQHLFCGFIKNLSPDGPGSDRHLRRAASVAGSTTSNPGSAGTPTSDKRSVKNDSASSAAPDDNSWLPTFDARASGESDSYWAEITPKDGGGGGGGGGGASISPSPSLGRSASVSSDAPERVREIDYTELEFDSDKPLGKGAFGVVFKARWRGVAVAVKQLLQYVDDEVLDQIRGECVLLQRCNSHPNIIKFIGMVHKGSTICIVTAFCAKGSLHEAYIVRRDPYTLGDTCRILRDAALGVLHLHKEHVIHRDIAARNVLLDEHDHVFVTDFGLARVKTTAYASTKSSIGPVQHLAPECIGKKHFSEKSDVFAFCVMIWEVTHRRDPYAGEEAFEIAMSVVQGKRLEIDEPLVNSAPLVALMRQAWKASPHDRPELGDVIKVLEAEQIRVQQSAEKVNHA